MTRVWFVLIWNLFGIGELMAPVQADVHNDMQEEGGGAVLPHPVPGDFPQLCAVGLLRPPLGPPRRPPRPHHQRRRRRLRDNLPRHLLPLLPPATPPQGRQDLPSGAGLHCGGGGDSPHDGAHPRAPLPHLRRSLRRLLHLHVRLPSLHHGKSKR